MMARRREPVAWIALVLAAIGALPARAAERGSLAFGLDRFDGTEVLQGWSAGAMWLSRTHDQDPFQIGLAAVRIEGGHWAYAAAGRTFRIGRRTRCDASARLGRASFPGQATDFEELGAILVASIVPGRWTASIGDRWLNVGDREGQLLQGGVDFTSPKRWGAGLSLFSGISGDLEEDYVNGSVRLRTPSLTWLLGATIGRTVPYPGASSDQTQSSTEVYLSVTIPLGRQQMSLIGSRFDGETATRRTLSALWLLPLSPAAAAPPEGVQP
ncbi:MAG TPA: hypothetical protein VGR38_10900 [Candidatus Polarisedimenticolia bacterium]|nr:hypothetical protein [Candidatus Polarisedimenticolia bacterium]